MIEKSIIITAGGVGKRMESFIPKQFLLLNNRPILMHTIEKFYLYDRGIEIILVLPKDQIEYWNQLCVKQKFPIGHTVVSGGKERFHSVKNGLTQVTGKTIGVHDAVRPLVSIEVVDNCFKAAEKSGAAIPVLEITQSLREIGKNTSRAVNRSNYKLVQTPQCFETNLLKGAYDTPYLDHFTDDASVVETSGQEIQLIEGNSENIKITRPTDLKLAEFLMNS